MLDDEEAVQRWNVIGRGTVKKSKAAITSRWFCKKANRVSRITSAPYPAQIPSHGSFQIWKPSFCSSPWIFGAPQPTFSSASGGSHARISR